MGTFPEHFPAGLRSHVALLAISLGKEPLFFLISRNLLGVSLRNVPV